jgi:hypothetical protein
MNPPPVPLLFLQFIDDELLRAPMLFDQLIDAVADSVRRGMARMGNSQRLAMSDLLLALPAQRKRMADYLMHSLREQVQAEQARQAPKADKKSDKPQALALVDDASVAVDVELSHSIETIKTVAEYEMRELQTYTAALVGDLGMSRDHNPFRPETWARAVWNSAQALPLSQGHQVAFMRHASEPLAQLLRTSYASTTSRLEGLGVEPAAYRTLILPSGSRRGGRSPEASYSPDLYRMSETMPAPLENRVSGGPASPPKTGIGQEQWGEIARDTTQREDRQAIELVSRLFEAMLSERRVPQDVTVLLSRLHVPAMRLALRDRKLLDQNKHPLWRFINQLVFSAEMTPDSADPERAILLKVAQATIEQLASEPVQNSGLYAWALERLDAFLDKRLTRRLASVSSQVGSLQKMEDRLVDNQPVPSTMSGPLDGHQLDTVPAEFMDTSAQATAQEQDADIWLDRLKSGDWVRMFFKGRWLKAQLLWLGARRQFFLFGDGASDETWAVRASALKLMHGNGLIKSLKQGSIVGSAAARVQEQMGSATAA